MQSDIDVDCVGQMLRTVSEANERISARKSAPTFDLDLETDHLGKIQSNDIVVKDKRDLDGVAVFQARMTYHKKKRLEASKLRKNPKQEAEIVCNADEIDALDQRTPWKKMDTWMKKSKLKEFGKRIASQYGRLEDEVINLLLELYNTGKMKKTNTVEYDIESSKIITINLPIINEMCVSNGTC